MAKLKGFVQQIPNSFGETRTSYGSMITDKLFTGQREMTDLGIYHYGARFYSPTLGRFLSADTIVPGGANSQAYDRYAYMVNNPLLYTDPTGHWGCKPGLDGGNCGNNATATPTPFVWIPTQPSTPTQSSTPTQISTPTPPNDIAQTLRSIAEHPFLSLGTPTQGSYIAPAPTSTLPSTSIIQGDQYQSAGFPFTISVDNENIDIVDLVIDGVGILGEVFLYLPEAPITKIVYAITEVVEFAGLGKSIIEVIQGDPQNLAVNLTVEQFERSLIMARAGRLVPYIGPIGNGLSIWLNLEPQIEWNWK